MSDVDKVVLELHDGIQLRLKEHKDDKMFIEVKCAEHKPLREHFR